MLELLYSRVFIFQHNFFSIKLPQSKGLLNQSLKSLPTHPWVLCYCCCFVGAWPLHCEHCIAFA